MNKLMKIILLILLLLMIFSKSKSKSKNTFRKISKNKMNTMDAGEDILNFFNKLGDPTISRQR